MSASLVGSEMCIRDRLSTARDSLDLDRSSPLPLGALAFAPSWPCLASWELAASSSLPRSSGEVRSPGERGVR
eukprot:12132388-Alexandrium_andersonii.AAC.1